MNKKQDTDQPKQHDLRLIALLITNNCVSKPVIEEMQGQGTISSDEMRAMNTQVANKVYTFLHYWTDPKVSNEERSQFLTTMRVPSGWDTPRIDEDFETSLHLLDGIRERVQDRSSPHRFEP